jgi:hypothetical protein
MSRRVSSTRRQNSATWRSRIRPEGTGSWSPDELAPLVPRNSMIGTGALTPPSSRHHNRSSIGATERQFVAP